jgi:hypothetical protein
MATAHETGHAKNVALFELFIAACASYGNAYNPSRPDLKLSALKALLANAKAASKEMKQAERAYGIATNNRELAFKPLVSLAACVMGALESSGANALTIEDARAILKKLQGKRATPMPTADPKEMIEGESEPNTRSTSQRSYDRQVDHLEKLITAVVAETKYNPNEEELQVASLNTVLAELQLKNKLAEQAADALSNTRTRRDEFLYAPDTGICDIVNAVKSYAVSAYKPTSQRYKKLTKFQFTRKRKKK